MNINIQKKPKKPLSPLQQNRLLKIILLLVCVAVAWLLFSPSTGIYGLLKLRNKAAVLEQQTIELTRANEELRKEIDRLKNDPDYLEKIAREKYGMLKKNEQVFDFSKPQHQDSD